MIPLQGIGGDRRGLGERGGKGRGGDRRGEGRGRGGGEGCC